MAGTRVIRSIIVDSDLIFRRKLKDVLNHNGYVVIGESANNKDTLKMVFQMEPDLLILEHRLSVFEGIDIGGIIGEHMVAPVVLTVELRQRNIEELARKNGVYGILVKPLQEISLVPVLETALFGFQRVGELQKEIKELRKKLESRRLVEQAKGLLMEARGLNEQQAYKYLQKLSMDRCLPIAKIAREIVLSGQHT